MESRYTITTARPENISALSGIERTAAELLRGHAPQSVLNEATAEVDLRDAQAHGRLWVALADDTPVGFALVEMLAPDMPHLEEIDVHPDHGRRGIGTALVRAICEWVRRGGYDGITLTTFRAVPWNMPFYAKLGFEELSDMDLPNELRAVVAAEASRGLDEDRRVAMKYRVRAA